ncbi:hypothetical protein A2635_04540 [Candidatus Peribacteria bacterium RIFCSPHIGHO2_01_FULL_51_9]|nr:MAG: hypothetical protein A2635_04540 [Candidatus Peribacteria bacterium RIFCSPHIGHO2_01_FULL_51_9]
MFSLNRVHLIGYQTQPVQVRQTPTGTTVTDLNIVVPYTFQGQNGASSEGKSFHVVTLWSSMAEIAGQFVRAGSQVFLSGRLQTDSWEDGETKEKRSKTKVVAMDLILLDPKSGRLEPPQGARQTLQCLNQAFILGNVTRDPEMRTTTSGQHVLTLGVATNERWKDRASNENKERTEFHNVVVWADLAQEVVSSVKKGQKVYVSGRVQTRSFETQAGVKRYTTEIIADTVTLLGVKNHTAEESIRMDGAPMRSSPASPQEQEPALVGAAVGAIPEINYGSEIKVEDLPF